MRLLVACDLHLEFGEPYVVPDNLDFDVAVLAGDISCPGTKAIHWAQLETTFGGKPVIFTPGNHEFYNRILDAELAEMKAAAAGSNVHILDRAAVVIGGVRFLGCTLWTDFQLPVLTSAGLESNVELALTEAGSRLNDFKVIEVAAEATLRSNRPGAYKRLKRLFRPADSLALHWIERDWLRRQLLQPFDGPTVVISHHAPSMDSVAPRYSADWLTPSFVSQLPASFFEVPKVWVHGHTHSPFDYMAGACRVVSNPRGYKARDGSFENHLFNPGFVVEVAT